MRITSYLLLSTHLRILQGLTHFIQLASVLRLNTFNPSPNFTRIDTMTEVNKIVVVNFQPISEFYKD